MTHHPTLDDIRREYDQGDPARTYGPDGCNAWGDDPDDLPDEFDILHPDDED